MKKNLLKEAIADAKTVKEVALANAKIALEESLSPSLTKMLEKRLIEEVEDEEEEKVEDEVSDVTTDETPEETEMPAEETPDEEETKNPNDEELEEIIKELEGEDETEDYMDETSDDDDEDINIDLEDDEEEEKPVTEDETKIDSDTDDDMIPNEDEKEVKKELGEAYKVITFLRNKLNEVNLLNAKLMYVTKLFKGSNLSEGRKVKIIETFDRAKTVREAKLIYSTLVEQVNNVIAAKPKSKSTVTALKESMASKAKPQKGAEKQKQIITESAEAQIARFKKLAAIK